MFRASFVAIAVVAAGLFVWSLGRLVAAERGSAEPAPASRPAAASAPAVQATLAQQAVAVLEAKCVVCHAKPRAKAPFTADVPALIRSGKVIPGDPDRSKLYKMIKGGRHPKGQALPTAQEIATIRDWIAQGSADPKAAASQPASQPAHGPASNQPK